MCNTNTSNVNERGKIMRMRKTSYCCGFFSDCFPAKLEIDPEQAELIHQEEIAITAEGVLQKVTHFQEIVVEKLMKVYDSCKKLTPDAAVDDRTEWLKEVVVDGLKIVGGAALGAALGGFTARAVGKDAEAKDVAVSTGLAGALCALWSVKNDRTLREKAKDFLSLVEDIKDDRDQIQARMLAIAKVLSDRFEFGIHRLRDSEDGIGRLANFFAVAITKGLVESAESQMMRVTSKTPGATTPSIKKDEKLPGSNGGRASSGSYAFSLLGSLGSNSDLKGVNVDFKKDDKAPSLYVPDEAFRIAAAVKYAIPKRGDGLYEHFWRKVQLKTADGRNDKNWTIRGLLLGSPLRAPGQENETYEYYVREGKIGKVNRVDKYPHQILKDAKHIPQYYLKTTGKQMITIILDQYDKDPVIAAQRRRNANNPVPPAEMKLQH